MVASVMVGLLNRLRTHAPGPPVSAWVVKPIVLTVPPVALASKPDTKFIGGRC